MRRLATIVCAGLLVSGCASRNLLRVDGAGPAVENPKTIEAVNLAVALNPAGLPAIGPIANCLQPGDLPASCKNPPLSGLSATSLLTLLGFKQANAAWWPG